LGTGIGPSRHASNAAMHCLPAPRPIQLPLPRRAAAMIDRGLCHNKDTISDLARAPLLRKEE
jgi:hypothetical protein